ncbi:MAG: AAA family ATPase [Prevotellaceae bacterium]|jgi:probable phosphoglycerate mutase|nr:AAA family ATPase [Prevotellaceae bacterium]
MTVDSIIEDITHCPYRFIDAALPSEVEKELIVPIFEEIIAERLIEAKPVEHPFICNVSGIPAAGKSTYCKRLMRGEISFNGIDFSNVLYFAFDEIMQNPALPYHIDAAKDLQYAFDRWEAPARIAGYELLKRAVDANLNILFEHSSSLKQHVNLFDLLISHYGYEFYFVYLNLDANEARKRVEDRAKQENRTFASERIDERYAAINSLLPEYKKLCKLNNYKQIEQ